MDAMKRDDAPEPEAARAELIKNWNAKVTAAKKHWESRFKRMRDNMNFVRGKQWEGDDSNSKYVANIVAQHVAKRKASLYAKNPTVVAKRRDTIDFQVWDEKPESLMAAMTTPQDPNAMALLEDVTQGKMRRDMIAKIGRTAVLLMNYYMSEGTPNFKTRAKKLIQRVLTNGVGYVKIGFQRAFERRPEIDSQISDMTQQLSHVQAMAADMADGEIEAGSAKEEELRQAIELLQQQATILVREGLVFDFPRSTAIIPDPDCTDLNGFQNAGFIVHEFVFSKEKIKEIYKVDVGKKFTTYNAEGKKGKGKDCEYGLVWEVYDKDNGAVFTMCDGYPDYLEEPKVPTPRLERFYPVLTLMFNDIEDECDIYPESDAWILRHPQLEHNRAREGLRVHRVANRPKYAAVAGAFSSEDGDKELETLVDVEAHGVVKMNSLAPGEKIGDKLQPVPHATIDPALYDTSHLLSDVELTAGSQEATLGGTSGATATESSIAEGSRLSSVSSNVDDLDDFLSEFARVCGQVLFSEVTEETAKKIAGPGAVWPSLSAEEIADELLLEIEAGSSGRPNKAQEIANFERLAPTLLQIPGIKPEWLARQALTRMDDKLDLSDALLEGMPSIVALNAAAKPATGDPATDPAQQGAQGGNNAAVADQSQPGGQPGYTTF